MKHILNFDHQCK